MHNIHVHAQHTCTCTVTLYYLEVDVGEEQFVVVPVDDSGMVGTGKDVTGSP